MSITKEGHRKKVIKVGLDFRLGEDSHIAVSTKDSWNKFSATVEVDNVEDIAASYVETVGNNTCGCCSTSVTKGNLSRICLCVFDNILESLE